MHSRGTIKTDRVTSTELAKFIEEYCGKDVAYIVDDLGKRFIPRPCEVVASIQNTSVDDRTFYNSEGVMIQRITETRIIRFTCSVCGEVADMTFAQQYEYYP